MVRHHLTLVCLVAACESRQATFPCTDSCECTDGSAPGTCEPTGYCSFEDLACASGRRYGTGAPASLRDECVQSGTTCYVSPDGSNAAGGGSVAHPLRTLSYAAGPEVSCATVIVMDGTYDNAGQVGTAVVALTGPSSPDQPLTFLAQHRGKVVLDGTQMGYTSCGASAYFDLGARSNVVIQGFQIRNTCAYAIDANSSPGTITFRWNQIEQIAGYGDGILVGPSADNVTIDGNMFEGIGASGSNDHGIDSRGSHVTIVNNTFHDLSYGWGILIAAGSSILIANNTFAGHFAGVGQIDVASDNAPISDLTIRDNVFYNPQTAAIEYGSGGAGVTSCAIDHNLTNAAAMSDGTPPCLQDMTNMVFTDPDLACPNDPGCMPIDLHLTAGSPAIDTALPVDGVTHDLENICRPQGRAPDIGAYEWHP